MSSWFYRIASQKYKAISFDIFDTLIRRNVQVPSDIFYLAGKEVLGEQRAKRFKSDRIAAEQKARSQSTKKEVTIFQIYDALSSDYEQKKEELLRAEIAAEINHCSPAKRIVAFAKESKNQGKTILLISDMYLPEDIIEKMLRKCGVNFYDALYISNVQDACKLDGSLFEKVLEDQKISPQEVIHFGDSIKADILGARKKGIRALPVYRKNQIRRMLSRCGF
jgi:predicted HAD superfamily hydrolase